MLSDGAVGVDDAAVVGEDSYSFCESVEYFQPMLERFLVTVSAQEVLFLKQLDFVGDRDVAGLCPKQTT